MIKFIKRLYAYLDFQKEILETEKQILRSQASVLESHTQLLAVLHSIIPYLHKAKEEPEKVVKGIVKRSGLAYRRTPEFKKKMSELTKARWAKKKGHIAPMAPIIQETAEG